jgi:hypothetical protein
VIEQTNLTDRSYFFETKETLIKNKIIKQTEIDGRTESLGLEETGRDLALLADYVERAEIYYQKIVKVIRENFKVNEYNAITLEMAGNNDEKANQMLKTLKSKLREIGWNSEELQELHPRVLSAILFERNTAYAYITALCSKYALFLSKIGINEIARAILQRVITKAFDKHFSQSAEVLPTTFDKKEQLENNAELMISGLDHPVYEYLKEYAQIDESKIYLPPYDITSKITDRFLTTESKEMLRSIFYLYGLGHEQANKEASDLIERYNQKPDNYSP